MVRHCEYENKEGVVPFRLPGYPLTKNGLKCAKKLGEFFGDKEIEVIYASPILRARQTAEVMGKYLKLKPVVRQEIDECKTPFQGMKPVEIFGNDNNDLFDIFADERHKAGGGESKRELFERGKKLIDEVIKSSEKRVVLVSHSDPILMWLAGIIDNDLESFLVNKRKYIPQGGVAKLEFEEEKQVGFEQVNY